MINLIDRFRLDNVYRLDTSNLTEIDTAVIISENIIDGMTKKLTNKNM